jgi:ferredoxin
VTDTQLRTLPLAPAQVDSALVKELVVISGKGGTGKTSVAASFAVLAGNAVLADCDVDAADLHLVLAPVIEERHEFASGHRAVVREDDCTACGACLTWCRFGALSVRDGSSIPAVDPLACEGCGVCVHLCPERAFDFESRVCGTWNGRSVWPGTSRFRPRCASTVGTSVRKPPNVSRPMRAVTGPRLQSGFVTTRR